jgi:hypothetical protein
MWMVGAEPLAAGSGEDSSYRVTPLIRNCYRVTPLIRNSLLLGPYSKPMPRALCWSYGGCEFLISEVPLYHDGCPPP